MLSPHEMTAMSQQRRNCIDQLKVSFPKEQSHHSTTSKLPQTGTTAYILIPLKVDLFNRFAISTTPTYTSPRTPLPTRPPQKWVRKCLSMLLSGFIWLVRIGTVAWREGSALDNDFTRDLLTTSKSKVPPISFIDMEIRMIGPRGPGCAIQLLQHRISES